MENNQERLCSIDEATCENIRENATFSWSYLFMNILATIIASYGLFANSPAVVIGAMLIAMLLGPIMGIGLALADSDIILIRISFSTMVKGVIGVVITAFMIGMVNGNIPLSNEIMARTSPNIFDLMIGLAGGAAGAYTIINPRLSAGIVGVAIATALVPPLASASILLTRGEVGLATGAFLLFFTNIIAIQFAASSVLWLNGIHKMKSLKVFGLKKFIRRNIVSIGILILLGIILSSNFQKVVTRELFESSTNDILAKEISFSPGSYLTETRFETTSNTTIVRAIMRGQNPPSAEQIGIMENRLPAPPDGTRIVLRIRFVQTTIMDKNGMLYSDVNFSTMGG